MVRVLTKIRYHVKSGFRHGFKNIIFSKFFFGFVASIGVILSSHDKTGRIKDNLNARLNDQEDTFDFVIVGGGTAGSLLANRLSEQHKILLLEAGGEPHPLQRIPGMALFMLNYRETDWMHRTVPQRRACFSSPGRRAGWCGGRNLGGTSNINYMVHMRGSPRDYDNWAKITGDQSWSYEALLHYFRKHENYQGDSPDREAHGFDGDMMLEGPSYTGMAKEFIRAGQELGYEHVDLNARFEEGFDSIYSPMEMGERKASFHAFLEPVRDRETLSVRKYSRVTKILIRSFDNTAFGVEYERHGVKKFAYATKEVILCAGAVETPKLLMLSGIGPKTHLADLGIPIIADLPVGKNLQDHLAVILGPFFVDPPRSFLIDRDITLKSFYEYKSDGNGPLSSSIFQAAAMISSKRAKISQEWNWPDILLLLSGLAGHKTFARDMSHAFNLNQKLIKKYYHHAAGRDSFIIFVSAARPQGRGDITLEKKDADAPPSVNPHYLENESDMRITIEGIKTALYLVENTTSFQNLRARFTNKKFPGCDHMPFRSDTYWECYTRHFSVSLNDGAGTCAMGNPDINLFGEGNGWGKDLPGGSAFIGAVVDPKLQVIGINHLRVVDASIMPQITGSQTQAATLMIAEKAADIIHEAWAQNENGPTTTTYKPFGWSEQMPAGAPQQHIGPPPQQYGPPPMQQYGPPPQQQQSSQYGAPPPQQQYGPPAPPPQQQYGPPAPPPQQQYGPPAPPPQQQYGPPTPPPQQQYGPPAPPPQQQYGPPSPPPQQEYGPPQQQYGPPQQQYGPPQQQYGPPMPPSQDGYGGPPDTSYGAPSSTMTTPMMMGEGGYMDMSTSSEPPPEMMTMSMMPTGNGEESQQMSELEETTDMTMTTPQDETTTMMTTTTTGSTTSTSMEPPKVSYGPPMDSMSETTTIIPNSQYGPPSFQAGTAYGGETYNGWSGAGAYLDNQYGVPPPITNNEIPQNGPLPYFTPPVPLNQNQDTTTAASSTSSMTSTEMNDSPSPFFTPPPADRAEPPYQPQIGNPLFGGGQDPRNLPAAGNVDSMMSSTTMSSGGDPPEENAPAGGAFNPVFADSATSESSAIEGATYKSFFDGSSPSGGSGTTAAAAARPDIGFLEHDTKLRPGVQISNPFPDVYYASQNDGPSGSGSDSSRDTFFQKYPIHSSVEYGNKIPSLPKISNGARPLVFGELLKKETSAPSMERIDTTPYPFIQVKNHYNKSAKATSRTNSENPPFVPYYNDKNRRPDEGTVKPTVLYKSFGQTNKVPSTANVPNIYYSVKDKVSKEGQFLGDLEEEVMQTSDGPPVMFAPTGPPPPPFKSTPSPIPIIPSAFGGSAASSSNSANYWTNASPKPEVVDNQIPGVEISPKDGSDSYWTNASPKPPSLVATPRGMDNSIPVDIGNRKVTRPGRLRALRRKPKDKLDDKGSRIVRIKSDIVWTTTQRPSLTTTFQPKSLRDFNNDNEDITMSSGRVKIRVRTKEIALKDDNPDPEMPVLSPYWTQGNKTASIRKPSTTQKPEIMSGTSTPTTAVYRYHKSATTTPETITVTPRPLLSVQLYTDSDKMEQASPIPEGGMSATMASLADDTGMYLSHPGFAFDTDQGSQTSSPLSWKNMDMAQGGNRGDDGGDSFGMGSVLPVDPHGSADDQTPGETLLLSNILGSVLRGAGGGGRGRRRRPPGNQPFEPQPPPYNSHYDSNKITGSTPRPSGPIREPFEHSFAASGNSGTGFMHTQVPDLFVQDDPDRPPPLSGPPLSSGLGDSYHHGDDHPTHKRFSSNDRGQHNSQPFGGSGGGDPSYSQPTGAGSGPPNQYIRHHDPRISTGHHGSSGEIPNPHHFDSGERERFNLFNDGVSSTVPPPPPGPPPPIQHPHSNYDNYHHNRHENQQNHQNNQLSHLPPPINQNYQVTTPGNDFSSPAYDENPLQFYRDATPKIPDRFQLNPSSHPLPEPSAPPSQPPSPQPTSHNNYDGGRNRLNYDYPTAPPNFPPPQHQNYHQNNLPPTPSGPPPTFIENSGELGQTGGGQFNPGPTGHSGGFSAQTNNLGSSFPPPHPSPFPSSGPPTPHPSSPQNEFGLGHSAPGFTSSNSPPHSRPFGSHLNQEQEQAIHRPPTQQFELPPRFAGLPHPSENYHLPPPPHPSNDDLGQIPDIFGFRNVIPSTVPPPIISSPRPTAPSPFNSQQQHHHHHHHPQQPSPSPTPPNFQDEFSVPQFHDFSSPPTTALQQSVHNILSSSPGPTSPQPPSPIGLPSPTGSSDLPAYLGDSSPKVYHDGVDPNKISLTYDDTGDKGFLDPPVIMGNQNRNKRPPIDITQISLTPTPGGELNDHNNHYQNQNYQQGNTGHDNFRGSSPSGPSGPPIQYQESKQVQDITQTREQILSQFGPQQDPEDHAQGDLLRPTSSPSRRPNQQPTRRPFGTKLHSKDNPNPPSRHPNLDDFGGVNLFQDNPFGDLLLPENQRHPPEPASETTPPSQEGFAVTPFEQPDFTRFEGLNHQNPSSVAPPQSKLKEYTIYSNPDDVDITTDQGTGNHGNYGGRGGGGNIRRRSDNPPSNRKRKRRRHHNRGGQQGQSTRRGGRAIRLRPLWGGDSRQPMKGRRRYYMLKNDENGNTTSPMNNQVARPPPPGSNEMIQKRASLEVNGTSTPPQAAGLRQGQVRAENEELADLSRELLNSFLGFGFGDGAEGQEHKEMLEQLLRNSTLSSDNGPTRGLISSLEDDDDMDLDSVSSMNLSTGSEELPEPYHQKVTLVPKVKTTPTPLSNGDKPTEWTPVEAATTNATITLTSSSSFSNPTAESLVQEVVTMVTSKSSVSQSVSSSAEQPSDSKSVKVVSLANNEARREAG